MGESPLPPNRLKMPSISEEEQLFSLLGHSIYVNESLELSVTLQLCATYNILRIMICYHLTNILVAHNRSKDDEIRQFAPNRQLLKKDVPYAEENYKAMELYR